MARFPTQGEFGYLGQGCIVTEFLTKFFPPKKLTKLRVEVQTFRQKDGKTLYEAWERYKLLTRQCPPAMFSK